MTISTNINTLEKSKFEEIDAKTVVRVKVYGEEIVTSKTNIVGQSFNKLEPKTTDAVSTIVKKVELPEDVDIVTIYHLTTGENLYLSGVSRFTAEGTNVLAVPASMPLVLEVEKGNNVELYCKTLTGTIRIYAYGMVKT